MTFDELKEKAHALPLKPGVYIMQDAKNDGHLCGQGQGAEKPGVASTLQDSASHTEKTRAMVSQIDHFDVIVADSEFEALVLENSLIKRHQPQYNILLKDDKGYPYIRLVRGGVPPLLPGQPGGGGRGTVFRPLRQPPAPPRLSWTPCAPPCACPPAGSAFPGTSERSAPASTYHMGQCDGYCRSRQMNRSRYRGGHRPGGLACWRGSSRRSIADLTAEMERAAEELRFERAAELRDRIQAIELLGKRQKVVAGSLADTDVVGFSPGDGQELLCGAPLCGGGAGGQGYGPAWRPLWRRTRRRSVSALVRAVLCAAGAGLPQADPAALRAARTRCR